MSAFSELDILTTGKLQVKVIEEKAGHTVIAVSHNKSQWSGLSFNNDQEILDFHNAMERYVSSVITPRL